MSGKISRSRYGIQQVDVTSPRYCSICSEPAVPYSIHRPS